MKREIQEMTNPVSETARITLFQLAANGDKDAASISEKLGLTLENTQESGSSRMSEEDMIAFRIVLEVRYRTMELLAEKSGCRTVADLPCGYTPLSISLARKGKQYLGLDLPLVISDVRRIIPPMLDEKRRGAVSFTAVDATNDESMEKALSEAEGNLCVLTSGLLMYLSTSELEALTRNIKRALDAHGGCWITADPEVKVQHYSLLKVITGDRYNDIVKRRLDILREKSDFPLGENALSIHLESREKDMAAAMGFLRSHGLRAERLSVADNMPEEEPFSFSLVREEQKEDMRNVFRTTAFWKITSDGSSGPEREPAAKTEIYTAKRNGGELELELSGRLDTLSAPKVLEFFEKESAEQEIRKVTADCSGLVYISSAGLRVLLLMQKRCSNGITLTGVNETVRDILQKTGFYDMVSFDIRE